MEELIKRLERVIATGVPDKDGQHPISAETMLEVVKGLSEHGTNLAEVGTDCSEFPNNSDTISRQDMVSRRRLLSDLKELITAWEKYPVMAEQIKGVEVAIGYVELIPSAQPERTCVNCGRTANNGGWYADGRTRCPIEEHYALPKDGFCYLWEKRNVTDDDYPEGRADE